MQTTRELCAGLALALLGASGCSGLGHAELESGAPKMTVAVTVDAPSYARNAPVLADVSITNAGEKPASVALPGRETLEFALFTAESPDARALDFVISERAPNEWRVVEPGETLSKRFVLPLAARAAGSFRVIALYRAEIGEDMVGSAPVASEAAAYLVTDPPKFDRDSNGVVSEADAKRVAEKHFARPAKTSRATFHIDDRNDMALWLVTVEFDQPDENGKKKRACYVNAYLGEVSRLEAPDDAETIVSRIQPAAGS